MQVYSELRDLFKGEYPIKVINNVKIMFTDYFIIVYSMTPIFWTIGQLMKINKHPFGKIDILGFTKNDIIYSLEDKIYSSDGSDYGGYQFIKSCDNMFAFCNDKFIKFYVDGKFTEFFEITERHDDTIMFNVCGVPAIFTRDQEIILKKKVDHNIFVTDDDSPPPMEIDGDVIHRKGQYTVITSNNEIYLNTRIGTIGKIIANPRQIEAIKKINPQKIYINRTSFHIGMQIQSFIIEGDAIYEMADKYIKKEVKTMRDDTKTIMTKNLNTTFSHFSGDTNRYNFIDVSYAIECIFEDMNVLPTFDIVNGTKVGYGRGATIFAFHQIVAFYMAHITTDAHGFVKISDDFWDEKRTIEFAKLIFFLHQHKLPLPFYMYYYFDCVDDPDYRVNLVHYFKKCEPDMFNQLLKWSDEDKFHKIHDINEEYYDVFDMMSAMIKNKMTEKERKWHQLIFETIKIDAHNFSSFSRTFVVKEYDVEEIINNITVDEKVADFFKNMFRTFSKNQLKQFIINANGYYYLDHGRKITINLTPLNYMFFSVCANKVSIPMIYFDESFNVAPEKYDNLVSSLTIGENRLADN